MIQTEKKNVSQSVNRFGRKQSSSNKLKTYNFRPLVINPKLFFIIRDTVEAEILCLEIYCSNLWWDEGPGYYNTMASQNTPDQCSQWMGAARPSPAVIRGSGCKLCSCSTLHCKLLSGFATSASMVGKGWNPPLTWSGGEFHTLCLVTIECFKHSTIAGLQEHYRRRTSFWKAHLQGISLRHVSPYHSVSQLYYGKIPYSLNTSNGFFNVKIIC